jgi:Ca2+/H+ antiporter, TMEM165/GDT1 family
MKKAWAFRGLKIAFFVVLAALALTFVVMSLWNWLMPALFGLRTLTFWQALGLLVLSKILLGGFRGRPGGGMHWRRRMMERYEQMTPEEREKFRQGMRGRCEPFEPPAPAPKP